MADKSKIEWTNSTWNPVTGCDKVSQGCKNCYAEREWARLSARRIISSPDPLSGAHTIARNVYEGRKFTDVQCHPERLDQPLRWRKPRRIFVNSMSDLFHEDVPDDFIDLVFRIMALCQWHTFQILTKRPERMRAFFASQPPQRTITLPGEHFIYHFPLPNVWLGISAEDQATADERIPLLLQTPAAVRWISAEPLLGPIDLRKLNLGNRITLDGLTGFHCGYAGPGTYEQTLNDLPTLPGPTNQINWVVAGGESGPGARPSEIEWFYSLRDQCAAAGVPFFMKQITERGRKIPFESFPLDLQVREYPQ